MTIVSGLATATGVSPLLNAPRELDPGARSLPVRDAQSVTQVNLSRIASATQTLRPVLGSAGADSPDTPVNFRPSRDSRYVLFIKAVQALRIDPDQGGLSRAQLADLMQAARDVFMLDDGVPRQVRPPTAPNPAERAAERSAERAELAERRTKARQTQEANEAALAETRRAESEAALRRTQAADRTRQDRAADGAAAERVRAEADVRRAESRAEPEQPRTDAERAAVDEQTPEAVFKPFMAFDDTRPADTATSKFEPVLADAEPATFEARDPEPA